MAQLRQDHQEYIRRGITVVVIGPEGPKAFKKYWVENELPFIGIPDPSATILTQFGQEVNLFKFGRMPAQILVDQQGVARFIHYASSMSDIPDSGKVFAALEM